MALASSGHPDFGRASAISEASKEAVTSDFDPLLSYFSTRPEPLLQQERHLFFPTLISHHSPLAKLWPQKMGPLFSAN
jgi:hypothetical protein